MSEPTPFGRVVEMLDALLIEEEVALRRLDHESLDKITDRKVDLLEELAQAPRSGQSAALVRTMRSLRDRALVNQMLMIHARELSIGMIEQISGRSQHDKGARFLEVRG